MVSLIGVCLFLLGAVLPYIRVRQYGRAVRIAAVACGSSWRATQQTS